jgi:hypothetical protein
MRASGDDIERPFVGVEEMEGADQDDGAQGYWTAGLRQARDETAVKHRAC